LLKIQTLGKVTHLGNWIVGPFNLVHFPQVLKLSRRMMLLYRLLYLPGLFVALPYYLYRMWRRGGYGKRFSNRFGSIRNVPAKRDGVKRIWIQAVSVGELLAIDPLLKEFSTDPTIEVILTTTTSTGYRLLEEKYAENTVWHGIFPMDFWWFSKRAWKALRPDLAILMEGELWPEHIHQAYSRKVPVLLINARLSDRSFSRHFRMKAITRPYFQKLNGIFTGSDTDQKRFRKLEWLESERIQLTGNLKLDLQLDPPMEDGEKTTLTKEMGFHGEMPTDRFPFVLLGSSTWPGDEELLLDSYISLREFYPELRLLLVPRHAERAKEIEALLKNRPINYHFRSQAKQAPPSTHVYVADTTGELRMLTQIADLVLIGKSLAPNKGGQTPVEAAALGKALIFGPDMSNFRDISRRLARTGAARKLAGNEHLLETVKELIDNPDVRLDMGKKAEALIKASDGATGRTSQAIKVFLS